MTRHEIDTIVMRKVFEEALRKRRPAYSHRIRVYLRPYLLFNQVDTTHATELVKRCIDAGTVVRVKRGEFMLTDAGARWLNVDLSLPGVDHDRVTKTP